MESLDIKGNKKVIKPFGMYDKLGYMFGDLGNSLFFGFISSYLMIFYTDVFGITAGAVGTMMVVARVWDAINDPIMGVIVDKAKPSKYGKFRHYLLIGALPVTILGFLVFTKIPGLPESMKLTYAYVTYIGFGMAYTAINIPYGSLASVMTSDPIERTDLSTWRNVGNLVANLFIMAVVPKIIFSDGGAATAEGFMKATAMFVVLSNLSYFLSFRLTTERVNFNNKDKKQKTGLAQTIKMIFKNRALLGVMLVSFGLLGGMFTVQALNGYLYKDYFNAPNLIGIAGITSLIPAFLVLPIVGKLVAKFGKKETVIYSLVLATIAYGALFILPINNPYIFMGITFIASIGTGIFNALVWALVADSIDYQEYLAGTRDDGIVYASYSLARKLCQAVAGGIGGFALSFIGYQSGVTTQTLKVAQGIKSIITLVPFVGTLIGLLAMIFVYNLSKTKLSEMSSELERRRNI